jgi:hypothetical protein
MPKIVFNKDEIIKHGVIDRELKKDEIEKGRLAVGVDFVRGFDSKKEVIEVIRRKK